MYKKFIFFLVLLNLNLLSMKQSCVEDKNLNLNLELNKINSNNICDIPQEIIFEVFNSIKSKFDIESSFTDNCILDSQGFYIIDVIKNIIKLSLINKKFNFWVKDYLRCYIDFNIKDKDAFLNKIIRYNNVILINLLLELGANINSANNYFGTTPLMQSILDNTSTAFKFLLDKGADVNIADKQDSTPFIIAVHSGDFDICNALIQKGADINKQDKFGCNAIIMASLKGNYDIVKLLINNNVNLNILYNNKSAIDLAYENKHYNIASLILSKLIKEKLLKAKTIIYFMEHKNKKLKFS